jgi:glycosyltransferase 2 family protein
MTAGEKGLIPKSSRVSLAVRIVISAVILGVLFIELNPRSVAQTMSQVDAGSLIVAIVILFGISIPLSIRWRLLIENDGHQLGALDVWWSVLIGIFFNQLLPTSMGGDVVRGLYVHRMGLPVSSAIRTVLIDRILGFFVLTCCVVPGLIVLLCREVTVGLIALASVVVLAFIAFAAICVLDLIAPWFLRLLKIFGENAVTTRVARVVRGLTSISPLLRKILMVRRLSCSVLALSIVAQLAVFAVVVIIARAINGAVGTFEILSVVPAAFLLASVPISIAGWGVREGAMIGAMSLIGLGTPQALTVSILFGLLQLIVSLPGGVIWWLVDRRLALGRTA